jgi:hypothetical protein
MKRTNTLRLAAVVAGLATALAAGSAPAAVWRWACQGETEGQVILFDRDGLYIASSKAPAGKVTAESIREAIVSVKKSGGYIRFSPDNENGGLESPIRFTPAEAGKQTNKAVFTEQSSKRISHRHAMVACRDEDTDLFRKVYRFERDGEPARDITMTCMEYQLSTKGGRKGCD